MRTIHVQHSSLGLRDVEFATDARPTILFLGDSFVWGLDAEADERFTELLRPRLSRHNIVAAGVSVPDPTERLVSQLRDFVQANGGKFFVGLQYRDPDLMRHLQAEQIPFVSFDGAEFYPGAAAGAHWTPAGHNLVAERILGLLSANNIVQAGVRLE
jgi:hypothetical protein